MDQKPSKTATQQKYIRSHYVRFPLDLRPEILEAFKAKCAENGTTATTEIKRFISEYIEVQKSSNEGGTNL